MSSFLGGGGSGGSSSITINTTPIVGGTDKRFFYDNAGTVGETASITYNNVNGVASFKGQNSIGSAIIATGTVSVGIEFNSSSGADFQVFSNFSSPHAYFGLYDVTANNTYWVTGWDGLGSTQTISGAVFGWSASATFADNAMDTGISRLAADSIAFGNGTPGDVTASLSSGPINITANASGSPTSRYSIGGTPALYSVPIAAGVANWFIANGGPNTSVSGQFNVGIGPGALNALSSGMANMAIGSSSLLNEVSGSNNIAIGVSSLQTQNGGGSNTAIGHVAGFSVTVGAGNVVLGNRRGVAIAAGVNNTTIGGDNTNSAGTGITITSGNQNIVIGSNCDVSSASANGQLSLGNFLYGTGLTGTGATISSGWIGIGKKAAFGSEALGVVGGITVSGDPGGVASSNTLSGINSTTISTGVGVIHMSTANPATNSGWLKCYIGTQVAWIPCWTTNAP